MIFIFSLMRSFKVDIRVLVDTHMTSFTGTVHTKPIPSIPVHSIHRCSTWKKCHSFLVANSIFGCPQAMRMFWGRHLAEESKRKWDHSKYRGKLGGEVDLVQAVQRQILHSRPIWNTPAHTHQILCDVHLDRSPQLANNTGQL